MPGRTENIVPPSLPSSILGWHFLSVSICSDGLLRVFKFLGCIYLDFRRSRAVIRLIQASRDILKIKSLGNGISRCFQGVVSTTDAMLFCLHARLGTTPSKCPRCSTKLHKRLTDLNLFKCAIINGIQNFETHTSQFYLICGFFFVISYGRRR